MALHPHLSDLAVVWEIVVGLWKVRTLVPLMQLVKVVGTPRYAGLLVRDGAAAKDVPLGVHGA
jgi:hypothetical protein